MRPDKDSYFLSMAELVATRSTCIRRAVGCVLVDARGHVLSTGYNGVAAGLPHCNHYVPLSITPMPHRCFGAFPTGGGDLDGCDAVHAESNALLQCSDVYRIHTCYATLSPCIPCTKLLMNTGCTRIIFIEEYLKQPRAKALWLSRGDRMWGTDPGLQAA